MSYHKARLLNKANKVETSWSTLQKVSPPSRSNLPLKTRLQQACQQPDRPRRGHVHSLTETAPLIVNTPVCSEELVRRSAEYALYLSWVCEDGSWYGSTPRVLTTTKGTEISPASERMRSNETESQFSSQKLQRDTATEQRERGCFE